MEEDFVRRTRRTQEFYQQHFPVLSGAMESTLKDAERLYRQAGCPLGETDELGGMQIKVLQWLSWNHKLLEGLRNG
jgi:hypothetical protein